MKKIVLVGNYGAGNTGDELLMLGALMKLKKEFNDFEVYIVTASHRESRNSIKIFFENQNSNIQFSGSNSKMNPIYFLSRLPSGVRSFINLSWIRTLWTIFRSDMVVFGGGGLFDNKSPFSYFIWGQYAFFGLFFKKDIIFYGQSVNTPSTLAQIRDLKKFFGSAKYISVRDVESKNVLNKLDIDNVQIEEDLALLLLKNIEIKNAKNNVETILISVRGATLWEDKNFQDRFALELSKKLSKSHEEVKIILIPFQIGAGSQDDLHICRMLHVALEKNLTCNVNIQIIIGSNDVIEVINSYKEATFVFACRLHSVIIAHAFLKEFVCLNYHDKVKNYLSSNNILGRDFEMSYNGITKMFELFDIDK